MSLPQIPDKATLVLAGKPGKGSLPSRYYTRRSFLGRLFEDIFVSGSCSIDLSRDGGLRTACSRLAGNFPVTVPKAPKVQAMGKFGVQISLHLCLTVLPLKALPATFSSLQESGKSDVPNLPRDRPQSVAGAKHEAISWPYLASAVCVC